MMPRKAPTRGSSPYDSVRTRSGVDSEESTSSNTESTTADTKAEIVEAAKRCFAQHGYRGTTNKMVAAGAGVAPALIYYYFDSKESLFVAVFDQMARRRNERLGSQLASDLSLNAKLQLMLDDLIALADDDPFFVEVFCRRPRETEHNDRLRDAFRDTDEEIRRVWSSIVAAAQETGELPAEIDQASFVDMIILWFTGLLISLVNIKDPLRPQKAGKAFIEVMDSFVGATRAKSRRAARKAESRP
jgi:AcrR family transcriptional regulator